MSLILTPETIMRNVLTGALIDEIGSRSVDDVLSKERSALISDAVAQGQQELDRILDLGFVWSHLKWLILHRPTP